MNSAAAALCFAEVGKDFVVNWRGDRWSALTNVSFSVRSGTICALVGANGAGKSTALKIAAGVTSPTTGTCRVGAETAQEAARAGKIGYLPENFGFGAHLTTLGALREFARVAFAVGVRQNDLAIDLAQAALAEVGLEATAARRVATLSRGQQQRLGLALAKLGSPRVLLLDEPASALDPRGVAELGQWLDARRRAGATVVMSSHFLPQLEEICDQFVLLDRGRVVLDVDRAELLAAGGLTRAFLESCPR